MKVVILNGNDGPENQAFDVYLERLEEGLKEGGHQVSQFVLREMDLRYCIGCWGCWVKTPGECTVKDASCQVSEAVIQSDFTLLAAPLRMGYPTALLKMAIDKLIQLIHPYFEVVDGEAHHLGRYPHYPRLGLLVEQEASTGEADLVILENLFSRLALNLKSRLEFVADTRRPADEITSLIQKPGLKFVSFEKRPRPATGVQIAPASQMAIFNGSPRGQKGNTPALLEQFAQGFRSVPGNRVEMYHLNHLKDTGSFVQAFSEAETVLLGFPLYVDAMPGMVKSFIEALEPLCGRPGNPPVGFLVQGGFPESVHSRYVERYLEKLASRLGSPYLGTVVKGGCEGVRLMPLSMNRKLFARLQDIGQNFAETGRFDPGRLGLLAKPERYPVALAPVFKLLVRLPVMNSYWNYQLKQNGAYERRFARPYLEENH